MIRVMILDDLLYKFGSDRLRTHRTFLFSQITAWVKPTATFLGPFLNFMVRFAVCDSLGLL